MELVAMEMKVRRYFSLLVLLLIVFINVAVIFYLVM